MRGRRVFAAALGIAWLAASAQVLAGPPQRRIPYQGRLEGTTGPTTLDVRLYAAPGNTEALWGPESHAVTLGSDGRFSLTIGSTQLDLCGPGSCSGGDGVPDLDQIDPRSLHLGITPSGGTELTPRQPLHSAPHAATSEPAIPVGGMAFWWGPRDALPPGFEPCDGNTPQTPDALLPAKPDARSRFLRGAPAGTLDVAAAPVTGGVDQAPEVSSTGTAITAAQIPSFALTAGIPQVQTASHSHGISRTCVSSDSAPDVSFTLGDNSPTVSCPGATTSQSGSHFHSLNLRWIFGGSNQTHSHSVASHSNLPAYAELLCIVRVR